MAEPRPWRRREQARGIGSGPVESKSRRRGVWRREHGPSASSSLLKPGRFLVLLEERQWKSANGSHLPAFVQTRRRADPSQPPPLESGVSSRATASRTRSFRGPITHPAAGAGRFTCAGDPGPVVASERGRAVEA